VLIQIDKFIYPVDFIVLDTQPIEACNSFPVILGRLFLATYNALINCRNGLMKLSFGNMTLKMNIFNICKQLGDDNDLQEVDLIKELVYDQFESTLSKTEFDESEELQMIYSQEEIKDKKGTKNVVADHLSRLTTDSRSDIIPIDDYFPDESLLSLSPMPWFGNFDNFLASRYLSAHWSIEDKGKFLNEVKNFYWDDPYLFKYCPDQIFQRCIPNNEVSSVIKFCYSKACGGYFSSRKTIAKILQSGFYWPTMFKDTHVFCKTCEICQKVDTSKNVLLYNS
jgi:Pyruvate/2-oxoacid:ferredoxin oxidoreductase delta subunit